MASFLEKLKLVIILCSPNLSRYWFPSLRFSDLSLQNGENGAFYVFHSINRPFNNLDGCNIRFVNSKYIYNHY